MSSWRSRGRAIAVALLLAGACGFEKPSAVAVVPIEAGGRTLYVKRQTWGFNGDETVISFSPDWRDMPRPGDRRWRELGPPIVVYRAEADGLHVWDDSPSSWEAVPGAAAAVPLVLHEVSILERIELEKHAEANGVRVIGPHDWPLRKLRFWER